MLAESNPGVAAFQSDLAVTHNNTASVLIATGKTAEALRVHRLALDIRQRLAEANPAAPALQSELAMSHYNIGWLLSATGKPGEAIDAYERASDRGGAGPRLPRCHPLPAESRGGLHEPRRAAVTDR